MLAANPTVQAAGSAALALAADNGAVPLLVAGCPLFGLGPGDIASLPSLIAQAEFAGADAGRAVALVTATSQAALAFAPLAFGMLRDPGPSGPALRLAAAWTGLLGPADCPGMAGDE